MIGRRVLVPGIETPLILSLSPCYLSFDHLAGPCVVPVRPSKQEVGPKRRRDEFRHLYPFIATGPGFQHQLALRKIPEQLLEMAATTESGPHSFSIRSRELEENLSAD